MADGAVRGTDLRPQPAQKGGSPLHVQPLSVRSMRSNRSQCTLLESLSNAVSPVEVPLTTEMLFLAFSNLYWAKSNSVSGSDAPTVQVSANLMCLKKCPDIGL